jgi:iron complex outermembrane receptor protein
MEAESVNAVAQNLTFLETQGIDMVFGYNLATERAGIFDFRIRSTYMLKWNSQFDATSDVEDVMEDSRVPEWRTQFTTNWTMGQWGSTLWINYVDSMNGLNNELYDGTEGVKLTIPSWTTANLSGYWTNDKLRVQLGVNNFTNEGPKADETDSWPFYPQEYHNAIGRQYYLRVDYSTGG